MRNHSLLGSGLAVAMLLAAWPTVASDDRGAPDSEADAAREASPPPERGTFEYLLATRVPDHPDYPGSILRRVFRDCTLLPTSSTPHDNEFRTARCNERKDRYIKHLLSGPGPIWVVSSPAAVAVAPYDFQRRGFEVRFSGDLGDRPKFTDPKQHPIDRLRECEQAECRGAKSNKWTRLGLTDGAPSGLSEVFHARERKLFIRVPDQEEAEAIRKHGVLVVESLITLDRKFKPWIYWYSSYGKQPYPLTRSKDKDAVAIPVEGLSARVVAWRLVDRATGKVLHSVPPSSRPSELPRMKRCYMCSY